MTNDLPTHFFETPAEFEEWLEQNHSTSPGVWVKLAKKNASKKTITYSDAVDVGLCYGWIDSLKRKFDEEYSIQKFTRRNPRSIWSKINTEKVERLIQEKRMRAPGLTEIERAKADGRWANAYDSASRMKMPAEFLAELAKFPKAMEFYSTLNKTNLYAIAFRLQTAKRPETLRKRTDTILEMLKKKEKFH